ncbi:SDR family NAD(P)-dependent oxidoreductase [Coralliovum pocilloporae]|uniref:SDR family NAD(P)-dependent oxidoreductase n=1 Tax=Coralliovum pocilloporae TaxID=3066369 RepID=UPI00330785BB
MTNALQDRLVVVTGASRGIGYHAALAAAKAGAHVVAIARTVGGLEDLDDAIKAEGGQATLVPLDLKDMEAIDRLGAALYERWGKLDGLIGNAGILGTISPVGHIEPKVWDEAMLINVTANWRLLRSFDPLLRQSDAGRAVFVTSGAAQKCKPFWGAYSTTKAALNALVKTYATENVNFNIRANVFSPGPVRTAMRAQAVPGEDPNTLPTPRDVAPDLISMIFPDFNKTAQCFDFKEKSWSDI